MNCSGRNTTSFTFTGLTNGTQYTLAIRASNLSGDSTAATVTATPEAPPLYTSNTGQSDSSVVADLGSAYYAQRFSTGGGAVDFYFGSIGLDFERAPGSGTLTVTLREENASGNPSDTVKYTLTNPANIGTGIQRFDAPYGVYLDGNENYLVYVSYSGVGTSPRLETTGSNDEDPGGYSGWSIQDNARIYHETDGTIIRSRSLEIQVKG